MSPQLAIGVQLSKSAEMSLSQIYERAPAETVREGTPYTPGSASPEPEVGT